MQQPALIIYRLGSLGDTVVALPCFHAIARRYPNYRRIVLTNEPVSTAAPTLQAVLEQSGLIDDVLTYKVGERSRSRLLRLLLKIRATGARDMVYLTAGRGIETVKRDLRFFRMCGLRRICAAPVTPDLHDHLPDPGGESFEPEAERLVRTIEALDDVDLTDRANWNLRLTQAEHEAAQRALAPLDGKPFFVFNVGGKAQINDWGQSRWRALFQQLNGELGNLSAVGVGGVGDFGRTQRLCNVWAGAGLALCGGLTPRQSAAVLSRSRFFVGHDSGPMHLAAATGIPTLGLFGNNNPPRIWHPYGPRTKAIHDMRGIEAIEIETVIEAILALAKGGA